MATNLLKLLGEIALIEQRVKRMNHPLVSVPTRKTDVQWGDEG
jgi:hypothetical protein